MVSAVDKRSSPTSATRVRSLWVEFVIGSRLASRVFLPLQRATVINSNSIWTSGPPLITVLATEGFNTEIDYQPQGR